MSNDFETWKWSNKSSSQEINTLNPSVSSLVDTSSQSTVSIMDWNFSTVKEFTPRAKKFRLSMEDVKPSIDDLNRLSIWNAKGEALEKLLNEVKNFWELFEVIPKIEKDLDLEKLKLFIAPAEWTQNIPEIEEITKILIRIKSQHISILNKNNEADLAHQSDTADLFDRFDVTHNWIKLYTLVVFAKLLDTDHTESIKKIMEPILNSVWTGIENTIINIRNNYYNSDQ